jgi:hypothetical protein
MARALVHWLDAAQDHRTLTAAEADLRKRTKMTCLGLAALERTMARQRSRVRHLADSDANTAYFHLIARGKKRRQFIPSLSIAGHTISDHEAMERGMFDHFAGVFGSAFDSGTTINFHAIGIEPLPLDDLDADISTEEVWAAIREMPADRAPGPDGFTGQFYKSAWHIVGSDVMAVIQEFSNGNIVGLERLNNAIIVLLPKKTGASCPGDFRPITMIHSFAKIVSKVLALRLAAKLELLVDKNQNAFIKSR